MERAFVATLRDVTCLELIRICRRDEACRQCQDDMEGISCKLTGSKMHLDQNDHNFHPRKAQRECDEIVIQSYTYIRLKDLTFVTKH